MTRSRGYTAAIAFLLLAGCLAGFPHRDPMSADSELRPELFFAGRTRGEGTLAVRGRGSRSFQVEGLGRTGSDGAFRLDQTVTFADGTVETRTFIVRRVDDTHYTGTLSGARGTVTAETLGNRFHLRYLVRQPAVYMEQDLYLQPDGRTALNEATVSVLGLSVARLSETIRKVD